MNKFLHVLLNPLPYLALAYGFHQFAPDVGAHWGPLLNDAAQWCVGLAMLVSDPNTVLTRFVIKIPTDLITQPKEVNYVPKSNISG